MHSADEFVELGIAAEHSGRFAEAIEHYRSAILRDGRCAPAFLNLGIALHARGEIAAAIAAYRRALEIDAGSAAAHFNLAIALLDAPEPAEAAERFREALGLQIDFPEAHVGLAEALEACGRPYEALVELDAALRQRPDYAGAQFNAILLLCRMKRTQAAKERLARLDLAAALASSRNPAEPESMARQLLEIWPEYASGWHALGMALLLQARPAEAEPALREAVRLLPGNPEIHGTLGGALQMLGRPGDAESSYRHALTLSPDYREARGNLARLLLAEDRGSEAEAEFRLIARQRPESGESYRDLGRALQSLGRAPEAEREFRRALELLPDACEIHNDLGVTLLSRGRHREACECFRAALESRPDYPEACNNLALALQGMHRLGEAEAAYRRALELAPGSAAAWSNLGSTLRDLGRVDEAVASFRRALEFDAKYREAHSNLLFTLLNASAISPSDLFEEHLAWARRHEAPLLPQRRACTNTRKPDRRLRLGYVSPDFRRHSVAYFIEPLLEHHSRDAFEVYCYSNVAAPDETTRRLLGLADQSRDIAGMSDARAADRMREDGIDILVDLAGHTARGRLGVFSIKPAPVQVGYLGYPNSTGLSSLDWRLTDAFADPPGASDAFHSEKLVRLPQTFLCFRPPPEPLEVRAAPCLRNGHLTFGSFNALAKLEGPVIRAWSRLLERVHGSRLMLKAAGLGDESGRARLLSLFAKHGIDGSRLTLLPAESDVSDHLARYHEVDIGLDPFPYNGTTTTFEALWMGVPVVSITGDRHAARTGTSILANLGLDALVAMDVDEYIARAAALAEDTSRLAELRTTMRERFRLSPLRDEESFARAVEAAYHRMWRAWCLA